MDIRLPTSVGGWHDDRSAAACRGRFEHDREDIASRAIHKFMLRLEEGEVGSFNQIFTGLDSLSIARYIVR